jgi:drug/metabolite transporter (DMT)-like permease
MTPKSESKPGGMGVFKYELLLLLISMIWGSAFVAQQIGMEKGLGPMTFNGLRFALGCLSLIPVILWRKKNLAPGEGEATLPYLGSLGAGLFLFAAAALQQIGLQYAAPESLFENHETSSSRRRKEAQINPSVNGNW